MTVRPSAERCWIGPVGACANGSGKRPSSQSRSAGEGRARVRVQSVQTGGKNESTDKSDNRGAAATGDVIELSLATRRANFTTFSPSSHSRYETIVKSGKT